MPKAVVEKKSNAAAAAAVNEVPESNGLVKKNDVPQVADALVTLEEGDHNGPRPEVEDATLPALTPATAERVTQIISSQTSLSKELQSKLPRLGEAMGGSGNGAELEETKPTPDAEDINNTTTQPSMENSGRMELQDTDVTEVALATISTDLQDLPEEFSAEWKQEKEMKEQEEEAIREERAKVNKVWGEYYKMQSVVRAILPVYEYHFLCKCSATGVHYIGSSIDLYFMV